MIRSAVVKTTGFFIYNKLPVSIKIPDIEKINGHNLYGRKFTLKPVNKDNIAIEKRKTEDVIQTIPEVIFSLSPIIATDNTRAPVKINENPSVIHSILRIFLLSSEIFPNPLTTDFVGKRCAIPHIITDIDPIRSKIKFSII
jgi:hypothetical protein